MPRKKTTAGKGKTKPVAQQAESLTLTDLNQVKVLANPLRVRILEELASEERTTKQVAQRLGEKPTKLYHHMEALERVGLIRLTRTQQNRGTIEKYYITVARQIKADSRIFSAADAIDSKAEGDTLNALITTMFDGTADELRGLIARDHGSDGIEEQGVLSYLEMRTDKKHAKQFQARLLKLLKSIDEMPDVSKKAGERRYRFTLAFYPLDSDDT